MKSSMFTTRYRPTNLDEVVGHTSVVNRLKAYLANDSLPGTMLIHGPSGVGKTTIARALANSYSSTANGVQIEEINAGNTGGVDGVRELIAKASTRSLLSASGKRFIIIDEAHLLTSTSKSVFLKPLETVSPFTYWILCTNHPEQLDQVLNSRCIKLKLDFLSDDEARKLVLRILKGEGKSKGPVSKIISLAKGNAREIANLVQEFCETGVVSSSSVLPTVDGKVSLPAEAQRIYDAIIDLYERQNGDKSKQIVNLERLLHRDSKSLATILGMVNEFCDYNHLASDLGLSEETALRLMSSFADIMDIVEQRKYIKPKEAFVRLTAPRLAFLSSRKSEV